MIPSKIRVAQLSAPVPRASEGDPRLGNANWNYLGCSPREQGWSHLWLYPPLKVPLFPAWAGLIPWQIRIWEVSTTVPRMSGGDPWWDICRAFSRSCSPRKRGWSLRRRIRHGGTGLFPAWAGVLQSVRTPCYAHIDVPRASGGDPLSRGTTIPAMSYSPCKAWVILSFLQRHQLPLRIPRASGVDPVTFGQAFKPTSYSPRKRGWSWPAISDHILEPVGAILQTVISEFFQKWKE